MEKEESQFSVKFLLAITTVVATWLVGWQSFSVMITQGLDLAPLFFLLYVCAPVLLLTALADMEQIRWSKRTATVFIIAMSALVVGCIVGGDHPILSVFFFGAPVLMAVCLFECIRWLRRCTTIGPVLITLLATFWFGIALHFASNILARYNEL